MPVGEGESSGTTPATPAVLQNVPFPSKLETKGNMASNWKRFRRVWSNYEIASRLVKQPKEERTATLLTCLGADALEIVDGLDFANDEERKDIDVFLEKLEVFCVGETNEIYERYQRDQESGESIDSYVVALRTPGCLSFTTPIRTLLKDDAEFVWEESVHDECLKRVKAVIASAPVLKYFDPKCRGCIAV